MSDEVDDEIDMAEDGWQAWAERELWPRCDIELDLTHRIQWIWRAGSIRVGAFLAHRNPDGLICLTTLAFDVPGATRGGFFTVLQENPLTITQSVLCRAPGCGAHGFIRDGRWIPV